MGLDIIIGIIIGMIGFILLAAVIEYVIGVAACMMIYNKTGHPKWASFIPIYNIYLVYDALHMRSYFIWSYIIAFISGVVSGFASEIEALAILMTIWSLLVTAVSIYMKYVFAKTLTESFGFFNVGMIICCIFFPRIMMIVCGCKGVAFTEPKCELNFKEDMTAIVYRIFRVNE